MKKTINMDETHTLWERGRVINRCNSCRALIREGEFAYIFDKGKKIEKPSWVKCEECYNQFQLEVEKYKSSVSNLWNWGLIINAVLSIIIGYVKRNVWGFLDQSKEERIFGFFVVLSASFEVFSLIIWVIRLIWLPYSKIEKLVYSVKEEEKEI